MKSGFIGEQTAVFCVFPTPERATGITSKNLFLTSFKAKKKGKGNTVNP
jgi:hypothetical protein